MNYIEKSHNQNLNISHWKFMTQKYTYTYDK